ncbi:glycosyltransferase family 4 protein [Spirosoma sp.]|uniref:glycosyltransferase family 4 protein n=1 Tax=Spirosoma sp. TaxID=1899569 RepID=UPI00261F97FD|nr:glycosyltransferase family 4 protein [Spirosoma sp.]MCX6218961.1 glycosyltransferase family 4 protein [Spirosoma sp.]
MVNSSAAKVDDIYVPLSIARKVITVGPDHIDFRGGIGSVMNVYARHFSVYKFITTHKPFKNKWRLIPFFIVQYIRFVTTLLQDKDIEIVHIQASSHGSFYRKLLLFFTARYGFGKKIIYHMHGSRFEDFYRNSDPVSKYFISRLVEKSDLIIGLSVYWREFFLQNFKLRRIEILNNVIHQPSSNHLPLINKEADVRLRVLFLGAIGQRKGIFDLLDVLARHRDVFEGRLVLRIGGNGETKRLQDYIGEHKLTSMVQFEGWVSGAQKHELLSTSDVYILPSYNEGLPISILEAMSYGLPIISTPVGGTAEVVHHGDNGFLVNPGDKQALYNSLMEFVTQPELAPTMGYESLQLVRQYLPETVLPVLSTFYQSLLAKAA